MMSAMLVRGGLALLLCLSCSGSSAPPDYAAPAPAVAAKTSAEHPSSREVAPSHHAPALDPALATAKPSGVFPPADFEPPFERTAKDGDGRWAPLEIAGGDPPVLWRAVVHPHRIKKFVVVGIVAVDRERARLHLVAGTDEPKSESVPAERRTGLVPTEHRAALIAAMNGGFKSRHGDHGMMLNGDEYGSPNESSCTIAHDEDGTLRIGTWPSLAAKRASMTWYRQTPPCLVEGGEVHDLLATEQNTKKWGSSEKGETEIRRSAMGISADGRTLLFAIGDWTTAQSLARAMKLAGAEAAAELDINYSYTRFTLYEHLADGSLKATSPLLPELKYTQRGYIESPAHRDFFYLVHRSSP